MKLQWAKSIPKTDNEFNDFNSIFAKNLIRNMNFERVGRSFYNPKRAVHVSNLEVWPGFALAV